MEIRPTVSVLINTYNHRDYIAQAIESALMQQTSFPVEIIIGDDESDDGTTAICREYAEKYPDRIRHLPRYRKDVIYINGNPTGRNNFMRNIQSAKGNYLALLPGDDYWTDAGKLQKQVEILDSHPNCVACHHWHHIAVRNEHGAFVEKDAPREGHGYFAQKVSTVRDIFSNHVRIKSRTVIFRNVFADGFEFPDWFRTVQFGDVALSMILGKFGDFYFLDEDMAVYRMTGTGVSTMGNKHHLFHYRHFIEWIRIWEKGDEWHAGAFRTEAIATIRQFYTLIFVKYNYSFGVFCRMLWFSLFGSRFSLVLRLKMAGNLIGQKFRKK